MKSQGFCCWSEQSLQQWPRLLQKCSWNYRRLDGLRLQHQPSGHLQTSTLILGRTGKWVSTLMPSTRVENGSSVPSSTVAPALLLLSALGPLMGSPTCSTTDVLLSWACLAEQQLCVEELTLGSIIPRGVFLPGVEGVLRRAWYRPMIQSQKQQQQMYTVSPLTQVTRTWLPRDIVSYASSMRIKKPFLYLFSALVYHKPTKQSVIM